MEGYNYTHYHVLPIRSLICYLFFIESPLSRFLTKTKSLELRTTFVQVMTSQSDSLRGGIIAEVLEKAITAQERMVEERVFKKKPGPS